jgi:CheY-like chemotaxis protein
MPSIVSKCPRLRGASLHGRIEFRMSEPTRTVLVVDDDPQMLKLVEKMLRPRTINVVAAPRPSEALRICENQPIHLLISDMAMPEMDGGKLADRVLQLHPEAFVLLISGKYHDAPKVERPAQVRFLKKPFFPSDLLQVLHEMLPQL